jgi:DeoR/GlpR family transcriptional regulator of sugar metabolism
VKRALRAAAERKILIAEGAKFTRSAMAVVCRLDEVDVLVTDDSAPGEALDRLTESGVRVIVV